TPTANAASAPDRLPRAAAARAGPRVAAATVDRRPEPRSTGDLTRPRQPGDHLGAGVDHDRVVVHDAGQHVLAPPLPPLRAAVEGLLQLLPLGQRAERPHEVVVLATVPVRL